MLLSLLVLSTITAVAVGMSVVILKDVEASSSIDRSLTAYYAAESGVESSLLAVKEARSTGLTLTQLIDSLDTPNVPMGNGASWSTSDSSTSEDYQLTFLRENQSVVLDLYDPEDPIAGGFESFWLEALDADPNSNPAWLEVAYVPWTIVGGTLNWDDAQVTKRLRSIYETQPDTPAGFVDIVQNRNYRVRIKALYDDLKNVKITAYTDDEPFNPDHCPSVSDCQKPIPNRVLIRATGFSGQNQVGMSASVPWQVPAAGIFDYVLFSEQTIDKRT